MKNIIPYIASLAVFISFFIIGVFLYWSLFPYKILELKTQPVPVKEKIVKAGEPVILHFNYCKYTNNEGEVKWEIDSTSQVILLPKYTDTTRKGCNNKLDAAVIVPEQLTPDTYQIKYMIDYQVNPIRNILVTFQTESFQVVR